MHPFVMRIDEVYIYGIQLNWKVNSAMLMGLFGMQIFEFEAVFLH